LAALVNAVTALFDSRPADHRAPVPSLELQEEQWDLRVLATSKPSQGYGSGPYLAYHLHLATLLRELGRDGLDPAYVASALLALVQPTVLDHQQRALALDGERIRAGLASVLAALV
jgi:hypothetical protein